MVSPRTPFTRESKRCIRGMETRRRGVDVTRAHVRGDRALHLTEEGVEGGGAWDRLDGSDQGDDKSGLWPLSHHCHEREHGCRRCRRRPCTSNVEESSVSLIETERRNCGVVQECWAGGFEGGAINATTCQSTHLRASLGNLAFFSQIKPETSARGRWSDAMGGVARSVK